MPEELTRVNFTNLGKVLYPELGITKAQIIEYYIRIAPKMLGLLVNRPLSLRLLSPNHHAHVNQRYLDDSLTNFQPTPYVRSSKANIATSTRTNYRYRYRKEANARLM